MADAVSNVNDKIVGYVTSFSGKGILNVIGWIVLILIIAGAIYWYFGIHLRDKKLYNKLIVVHEIVNGEYIETYRDTAKSVKLGSGGFEIVHLKKLKTWKIAFGGRTGRNRYDFYILPDGYWYTGRVSADLHKLTEDGGVIKIFSTNPLMRGQYTSLEKLIDNLHKEKQKFWDKYGSWILAVGFILISGVMLWLSWKQQAVISSNNVLLTEKMGVLLDRVNTLLSNFNPAVGGGSSGLIPAS